MTKESFLKRKSDESRTHFPRKRFTDDSRAFWLSLKDDYFTPENFPSPDKIRSLAYKSDFDCKKKRRYLRGKQFYVNYNVIWPFLFYPIELKVILHHIKEKLTPAKISLEKNRYLNSLLDKQIQEKLKLPFYKKTQAAMVNTLSYMFFKMRSGIYVKIQNNKLKAFIPFFNLDYKNDWNKNLTPYPKTGEEWLKYRLQKTNFKSKRLEEIHQWEAHGCLIFNWEINRFSDRYIALYVNMFKTLCQERKLPDVEFFLNKNDFPMLKKDLTQPNPYVYKAQKLSRFLYNEYAPILSNCITKDYADFLNVTPDDWQRATRSFFPPSCDNCYYKLPQQIPWKKRIPTAFFRGASTGCGDSIFTNQRLKVAQLCQEWQQKPPSFQGKIPLLNAGVTRITPQDTVLSDSRIGHVSFQTGKIDLVKPVPMNQQSRYKYLLDLEGYAAAFRLGYLLGTDSTVLRGDTPWQLWYTSLLKPLTHYVPVKHDLSDLDRVIYWCRQKDSTVEKIAQEAKKFQREKIRREGILDYLQLLLVRLSEERE